MILEQMQLGAEVRDDDFNAIYPSKFRKIARFHFTPVEVAKVAAAYLVDKPGTRVLDVGSGAGKFCMVGAACTEGHFTGVEQRKNLHRLAINVSTKLGVERVDFIHSNILGIDFGAYDAIYYFNSFFENIAPLSAIDQALALDKSLYTQYTQYMHEQLDKMSSGTRLVTYFSFLDEIPDSYKIKAANFDLKLKCWEKAA
ncbi:MAG: methyltransferase domain-containing protein [Saprospiraceae bacterium]